MHISKEKFINFQHSLENVINDLYSELSEQLYLVNYSSYIIKGHLKLHHFLGWKSGGGRGQKQPYEVSNI